MLNRSFVHALLSLLLLVSQQIGATHVYSHWVGTQQTAADRADRADRAAAPQLWDGGGKPASTLGADQGCLDCMSVAQLAVAIGSPILTVAASPFTFGPVFSPATLSACVRTTCVFESRAPPQA